MTIPHDEDWTPSSLTGSDSSLTGSALEGGSSTWSSGSATSSTGPGWSSDDRPLPSTAREEAQTSLRLDSIATPSQQGPVSARIGRELLGEPAGATPPAEPPAVIQQAPAPDSAPPAPADPVASAPPGPGSYAPPTYAPPDPTAYAPPDPTPYAPAAPGVPPTQPGVPPPEPSTSHPTRPRGTGRIRSLADLEQAKREYEQGHRTVQPRQGSRRNGAYSTLILGLIAAAVVAAGWAAGEPAPGGGVYFFGAIAIIAGLATVAKPVDPPTRNRVLAVLGMALAIGAFVAQIALPW